MSPGQMAKWIERLARIEAEVRKEAVVAEDQGFIRTSLASDCLGLANDLAGLIETYEHWRVR